MRVRILGIRLDDLARHRRKRRHGGDVREVVVGLLEPDAQGVAIDDLESGNLRVVVESTGLFRPLRQFVEPDDLAVDDEAPRRPVLRVHQALDRIRVVLGGKLAALALERGIGVKDDALADVKHVRLAVVADLGQRFRGQRNQLGGPRQVVVGQQRLVGLLDHAVRVLVGDLDRVEAGLLDLEGDAQNLVRIRGVRNRQRQNQQTTAQSGDAASEYGSRTEHCVASEIERRVM